MRPGVLGRNLGPMWPSLKVAAHCFTCVPIKARTRVTPGPPRIVITGTGRAGTTLLVQILTDLGLDTGFAPDTAVDPRSRAGLEIGIDSPVAPRIVKSPHLSWRLAEVLGSGRATVEHVIVPIRNLHVASASRVRMTKYGSHLRTQGGLFGTVRATRQSQALALLFFQLIFTTVRYELPVTFLEFPRFALDWEYTYRRLRFLDPSIPADRWRVVIEARTDPTLIHEVPLSRSEQLLTLLGTAYNRTVGRAARGAATLLGRMRVRR